MNAAPFHLGILGTGPVGMALALWLARNWNVPGHLILQQPRPLAPAAAQRSIALSQGSTQLLQRVLPRGLPGAPIEAIEVQLAGRIGTLRMKARDHGLAHFGQVVRYGDLCAVLAAQVHQVGTPIELTALGPTDTQGAEKDNAASAMDCLVHAEGAPLSNQASAGPSLMAYTADVSVAQAHQGVAFERFTASGPMAMLPLADPRQCTLIWCRPPVDEIDQLKPQFERAFEDRVGRLEWLNPLLASPLHTRLRRRMAEGHEVWIGNAAQTLHPVAGQGLNLGLRDAFALSEALAPLMNGVPNSRGNGAPTQNQSRQKQVTQILQSFAQQRSHDRMDTKGITDWLAQGLRKGPHLPAASLLLGMLNLTAGLQWPLAQTFMYGQRSGTRS